ncbi:MAG: presqualene diphosphate synthase HpnD [Alphaproteobacteria bacterium]|nr:presqualene diphosphate synthase HpnD [Alphaproteobacteria bacterium]
MKTDQALEHVTAIVRESGTSFYWAMRMLPSHKRDAMYAVYAFCREVDDIADDPGERADKLRRLADWRVEVERLFSGRPQFPVTHALVDPVEQFGLRKEDFLAVIEGMEIDSSATVRMPTVPALEDYCDRVACAVGRLSNRIFGVVDELGEPVAVSLGQALQLTNILRDLDEDAGIDRLYVPNDMLAAYDIPPADVKLVIRHPRFPEICEELAAIAHRRYQDAERALAACDRRTMRPAIMMMQNYRRILDKLVARGWSRLDEPISLSKAQKLWLLMRYALI